MWVANYGRTSLTRIPDPDAATVADIGFVMGNIALPAGSASGWGLPQTVGGCAPVVPRNNSNPGSSQPVPALGEWALAALALAMLGLAAFGFKRRS
jgi:hypothetical protein